MSVSVPSRIVYSIDVPEVRGFSAQFNYNFFAPDESVSETGGIPSVALARSAGNVDSNFLQYAVTRVPRFVRFNFFVTRISDPGDHVDDLQIRNNVFGQSSANQTLISDNIDKIVDEDFFATGQFIALNFNDGELLNKVHNLVSGSFVQQALDSGADTEVGSYRAAQKLHSLGPKYIKPHFLFRSMADPVQAHGTRHIAANGRPATNAYFDGLHRVTINAQLNGKLLHDVINRSIKDPNSPFAGDLVNMQKFSKKVQQSARQRMGAQVTEADFKTVVPFIDVRAGGTSHHVARSAVIVGFIIDKTEILSDGTTKVHPPIVIENSKSNLTADFKVKYGSTYTYSIKTIAQFILPAIDDDTGEVGLVKALVSSKPSNKVYVKAEDVVAPPPPNDLNFTWDYERINPKTSDHDIGSGLPVLGTGIAGSLLVHWTFPPNSQRDIKKFQVFRRKNVGVPFELIKMYDFDDSVIRYPNNEDPAPNLVENIVSPCSFMFDDDFLIDSKYIYTVASIDAHGFTSNYSAQYEIWFDRFKNKLQKKLISHAGAPKPYPNLYLEADAFVDTIRVSGPSSKQARLYFNPEFYYLFDDQSRITPVIATKQLGGAYKLQLMNLDNQKSEVIDISIDDRTNSDGAGSTPEILAGKKRLPKAQSTG